jgi:hypothetical protein
MSFRAFRPLVVLGVCWLLTAHPACAEPVTTEASSPAGSAGSWVQVDPQTGQRVPSQGRTVAVPPNAAFSSSHAGLVEVPAPAGGMMIDLQGRFRSAATATVDANGHARVDCIPPGAATPRE